MALKAQLSWFACVNGSPDLPPCVLLFGCFVKGSFNTQRGVKNLIGQFGVLHPLHPQCGCSSEKMCEQRTWTVCCFLLGPKPITLESINASAGLGSTCESNFTQNLQSGLHASYRFLPCSRAGHSVNQDGSSNANRRLSTSARSGGPCSSGGFPRRVHRFWGDSFPLAQPFELNMELIISPHSHFLTSWN